MTTTTMDTIDTTDTTTSRVCYATCNLQLTLTLASAASSSSASALSLSAASPLPPFLPCALEQFIAFIADRRGVPPFLFFLFFFALADVFFIRISCGILRQFCLVNLCDLLHSVWGSLQPFPVQAWPALREGRRVLREWGSVQSNFSLRHGSIEIAFTVRFAFWSVSKVKEEETHQYWWRL